MSADTPGARRVTIDPLSRVEGHGKVTLLLDEDSRVSEARLHIVEFRGFEKFIQGRPYWEAPVVVQRLCGICPVSHHLAAGKALDGLAGVDRLTPTAEKLRRLLHLGQMLQSHAVHFFHLASPDLLFGVAADPARRNFFQVAESYPEAALKGIRLRRFGQEVIRRVSGKRIHGVLVLAGGVNQALQPGERDRLWEEWRPVRKWAREAVTMARELTLRLSGDDAAFARFPSHYLGLVDRNGALELYDGGLRVMAADGNILTDHFPDRDYRDLIHEQVRPWSYMKFPFLTALGPERGWYRVGPLARLNLCSNISTPDAEAARQAFFGELGPGPVSGSLFYHWARMIELLYCAEAIGELLTDEDLCGDELMATGMPAQEGVGVIEAPRGTLIHRYVVDEGGLITEADLIVATTHNNQAMNEAVRSAAQRSLGAQGELNETVLNSIEVAVRAYDPCLSCATHALGRMPLRVELRDAAGSLLDCVTRDDGDGL